MFEAIKIRSFRCGGIRVFTSRQFTVFPKPIFPQIVNSEHEHDGVKSALGFSTENVWQLPNDMVVSPATKALTKSRSENRRRSFRIHAFVETKLFALHSKQRNLVIAVDAS